MNGDRTLSCETEPPTNPGVPEAYARPMILAFAGNWDATALGTLALAVATFVSLLFARRTLGQMQQQIKLGQKQLEQTQAEMAPSRKRRSWSFRRRTGAISGPLYGRHRGAVICPVWDLFLTFLLCRVALVSS
jgi:hypothetical protein